MAKKTGKLPKVVEDIIPEAQDEFEEMLYARNTELESFEDLEAQRGTPIPSLFNYFHKFITNPSSVSVETYKRMVDTDDTIGSGVDFLTTCLAARLGRYQHPNQEITEFVNKALDNIQGGWMNCVKEMLSASWNGFSVTEKVWQNTELGFVPMKLITLPPSTILFETERTGQLTSDGILQYQRNWNPMMTGRSLGFFSGMNTTMGLLGGVGDGRPDPMARLGDLPFPFRTANMYNYLCIRIPRQKCIHYAFDAQGKFGNPYGRSMLRRAYKYYVLKDSVLKMLAVALDRKGTPLTLIFADANTTLEDPEKNGTGDNARGQRNKGTRADKAAIDAFKNIHNDSVVVLPGKRDDIYGVESLSQQSNASDFILALDWLNKSSMRALLIPSLIFGNGDGTGSYSLGQEHAKTFDKILDGMNAGFEHVLKEDLIKEIIGYNFPESMWKKEGLGSFSKRQLSQDEINKEMECYEKGIDKGIIDTQDLEDLNKMRDTIGFEPRKTPIERPMAPGFGPDGMPLTPAEALEEDEEEIEPGKKPAPKKEAKEKE